MQVIYNLLNDEIRFYDFIVKNFFTNILIIEKN